MTWTVPRLGQCLDLDSASTWTVPRLGQVAPYLECGGGMPQNSESEKLGCRAADVAAGKLDTTNSLPKLVR
jgi:hypothetical protein